MMALLLSTALLVMVLHQPTSINAFSSFNSNSNTALLSRLQTVQAELVISIGRVPGTAMPPEWAASGAKLGFVLEVEFTNEQCDYEMNKERLLKRDGNGNGSNNGSLNTGSNLFTVEPLNEPSFVSVGGQQTIAVESGAYGCQIQGLESRQYALPFFLDFPEGAKRNDVELPAERIYFLSSCWLLGDGDDNNNNNGDSNVLQRARGRQETILKSVQQITQELEQLEQSPTNIIERALAIRKSFELVERRAKLNSQLGELEQTYPLDDAKIIKGPNNSGIIFAKEGMVAVKRFRGAMGTREQYHWVGTFSFNDFFEDE